MDYFVSQGILDLKGYLKVCYDLFFNKCRKIYQSILLGTFKSDFKLLKCKPNGISGDIFQNLSNIIYNKHYFVMYLIERDR